MEILNKVLIKMTKKGMLYYRGDFMYLGMETELIEYKKQLVNLEFQQIMVQLDYKKGSKKEETRN